MRLIKVVEHCFLSFFPLFISENLRNLRPYLLLELKCVSPTDNNIGALNDPNLYNFCYCLD